MADELASIDRELKRRERQAQAIDDELTLRQIDYNAPDAEIRRALAQMPKRLRQPARRRWAENRVRQQRDDMARTTLGTAGQTVNDTVRNLARGTLVGPYLDEFAAWAGSGFDSESDAYKEGLAYERELNRAIDEDYGLVGAGTKVAGGVASAVVSPIGNLFRGGSYAGNVARGGAVGAGYGAAAGFGEAEGGMQNRLQSAGTGAQYGAAFGSAVPAVAGAVAPAAGAIYSRIRPATAPFTHGPERAADLSIAQRVRDAGDGDLATGVNRLVDDIQQGQQAARLGPNSVARLPETLGDRTDGLRRLTGTIYRQGGRAGEMVEQRLTRRQRGPENLYSRDAGQQAPRLGQTGQAEDIRDAFYRALQVRSSDTPSETVRRLKQEARQEGERLYNTAFQRQARFQIDDLLIAAQNRANAEYGQSPIGRSLLQAVGLFTRRTPAPTAVGAPAGRVRNRVPVTRLEQFDAAKKDLDDLIDKAIRAGENNKARELTQFKNDLLARIDAANPDYATARTAWGGRAQQQEAVELGRNSFREDSQVTADQFRELSEPLQRLFRVGQMDALRQLTQTARPGTDVSRIFQQERVVNLLRETIPNTRSRSGVFADRSGRFGEYISRQGRMVQTRNTALGGSPTAKNLQDDAAEAVRTLQEVWDQFRQSPNLSRMIMDGLGVLGNQYLGFRQDVAMQMARRLVQLNPDAQIRYLRSLERRVGPDPYQAFMEGVRELSIAVAREGSRTIGRNVAIEEDDG